MSELKVKVIYIDNTKNEVDIVMSDNGVACIHHNGDNYVTTYYQSRFKKGTYTVLGDNAEVWEDLGEGKAYCGDWNEGGVIKQEIDDEMIMDAIIWLGGSTKSLIETIQYK